MILSIIAAMSENRVIGKDKGLPWYLPADLQFFKSKTLGHTVIMGRKTFDSVGKPLPNRRNIVITRQSNFSVEKVETAHSIEQALALVEGEEEVFIAGGGEIYRQSLAIADRIYLTIVHHKLDGDTFFPPFDESEWDLIEKKDRPADNKNQYSCSFLTYFRRGANRSQNSDS